MNFHPTRLNRQLIVSFLLSIGLIISCSKDSDLIDDALFNNASQSIEDRQTVTEEESEVITDEEPVIEEEPIIEEDTDEIDVALESRTTSFPAKYDAHYQTGKSYNQHIVRLEEGNRTSYLMFDLSQIDSIGGQITAATLQFTINSDDGDGTINVHKGNTEDWTEHNLTTIPEAEVEIGSIIKQYKIGATEEIELEAEELEPKLSTLILDHEDGNDLAFASKEHPTVTGPQLVVTYDAPIDSEEILISDSVTTEEEVIDEEESEDDSQSPIAIADGTPSSGTAPLKVTFKGSNSTNDSKIETYKWVFQDGSSSNNTNPEHTFEKAGEYEVELTVTDNEGNSNTDTVTITVNDEDNEAPKAVVAATPSTGTAPLKVQFKGSSSTDDNGVKSYAWDFKDGDKATNANPEHTFEEAGEYQVSLTVKDENGLSSTKTVTVKVSEPETNEAPKAVASATPTSGVAPLEVQFKGSNSTDDTKVKSYKWDFKDGSTSTSSNPSHTFAKAGEFKALLTVTDEDGLSNSKTVTITVTEPAQNEAPKAVASATPSSGEAALEVQFKGSSSTDDDKITSYHWDFKDGSTSTSSNPSHTFNNAGSYSVKLTVKDAEGLTSTKNITITVNEVSSGSGGSNGNYPSNAVFASDYGFKSGDATSAFEKALNSGKSYVVIDKQSSDWVIQPTKFIGLSNMTIVFEPGVVLRAKSGAFSNSADMLLNLVRPKNILIEGYGATFKMNKSEYNQWENRHALAIHQGDDVTVKGLTLSDSGGDGLYIAGANTSDSTYSNNIIVEDVICDNNRRQGMSIISAENVWVRNSTFKNTSGTNPETGVDIEPANSSQRLVNINFTGCKFTGNDSHGFLLSPYNLNSSSRQISITVKDSEFQNNTKSPDSGVQRTEIYLVQSKSTNPVKGNVLFEGIKFSGSKYRIIRGKKMAEAYKVTFKDCSAYNVATSGSDSVIELEALSGTNTTGNYVFDNFYLEYNRNIPFLEINAPTNGHTVKNISGSFKIKEPYNNPIMYSGGYKPSKNSNVDISYNHIN